MVSGHNWLYALPVKGKQKKEGHSLQAADGCVWDSENYEVRLIARRPKITGASYWKALADVLNTKTNSNKGC